MSNEFERCEGGERQKPDAAADNPTKVSRMTRRDFLVYAIPATAGVLAVGRLLVMLGEMTQRGPVVIDLNLCKECGGCAAVCSTYAIEFDDPQLHIIQEKCWRCRACEQICPTAAIKII